ncbi:MAG: hypothetical protein A2V83_08900 [Nitrospirae bacterium RBG_16_64_22]|nr:MAG: hypothetical protein A2V83_08900 [Nitrospirae bacterium RBG_16_64_22]
MSSGKKILVVEDSAAQASSYLSILGEKYDITLLRSGTDAIKRIGDISPDLVILDLVLPDFDGLRVLQYLRERVETRFVPVLIVSSRGDVLERIRGLETGAHDYLAKPFDTNELRARVEVQLRIADLERERREAESLRKIISLAATCAHEINNPLTVIGGQSQLLLRRSDLAPEVRRGLELVRDGVDRIQLVIQKMGSLAKAEETHVPGLGTYLDLDRSSKESSDEEKD